MVPATGAAVGFALDPDADRLAIVDEKGRYIGEELTLALAAARRLGQEKGPVILNLSTSRVTETLARAAGCVVFRTPVGEINVVQRMVDVNAVLGGEGNGGVIDPRVGYVRDSFVGMAMVLDLMAATGEPLSSLVAGLPRYAMVKEQFPLASRATGNAGSGDAAGAISALWDRVADTWPDAKADRRDGLRLEWNDRWVHVRASNTEPIVRVIAEAAEPHLARELADQVGRIVKSGPEAAAMTPLRSGPNSSARPPSRSLTSTARCSRRQRRSFSPASSIAAAGFVARSCSEACTTGCSIVSGDWITGG